MILLREVEKKDLDALIHLSQVAAEKHPGFLNLSNDKDQWKEKIQRSIESFSEKIENKMDGKYIFVAEDTSLPSGNPHRILGVSMISAQHGTPESPHFYFDVGSVQKYSQTINTGFIHGTLRLKYDTDGPTEIGGLLILPDFRNSEEKLGRQISFVRFLFMGLHKSKFRRRVLAELLPPLTKKGKSPLWEAVGRRFTNMDYTEADILSSKNKEFILSLFPTGKMYVTFLPAEARNAIGKVSKETEPVMHMLKKIGFHYKNQVDPFDGGPHLIANMDEILPIKKIRTLEYVTTFKTTALTGVDSSHQHSDESLITEKGLLTTRSGSKFKALSVELAIKNQKATVPSDKAEILGLKPGDTIFFMPYY